MVDITRLDTASAGFDERLDALIAWEAVADTRVHTVVTDILQQVKRRGDAAVIEFTKKFDAVECVTMADLEMDRGRLQAGCEAITKQQLQALQQAAERIRAYAERQKMAGWEFTEADGTRLGQQVTPLDRVGIYVPGGKAAYPSSVLMNAIPASVASVQDIIMVVPTPNGVINEMVLAAAHIAGVDRVFTIGGAQAVAALAYGTETVPAVDKIVGPGNIYVAAAKRMVFGTVGIDMIAGPSEILVVCDGHTNPEWIAADLFSQAEHDEDAQAILLCPDEAFIERVLSSMDTLLGKMDRADIIRQSLSTRGAIIKVSDLDEAMDIANRIAPEHLELSVEDADQFVSRVRHAGAIFVGRYTAEALGDYCAGPNHVLPTSGTARFSSPLGVYDFQKRSSIIHCSADGAATLGRVASVLARGEGLDAHACSAECRLPENNDD